MRNGRFRGWRFPIAFELLGPRDPELLDAALRVVVRRQDALRVHIASVTEARQRFVSVPERILERRPFHSRAELAAAIKDRFAAPMDLGAEDGSLPAFHATLFERGREEAVFFAVVHHMAWDERSLPTFGAELSSAYRELAEGLPADRAPSGAWPAHVLRQHVAGAVLPQARADQWHERLAGSRQPDRMPDTSPEAPNRADAWSLATRGEPLGPGAARAIERTARRARVTAPTVMHALVARSLRDWSGLDLPRYHYLHHGRDHREDRDTVGFFARSVPMVARDPHGETFEAGCQRLMRDTAAAVEQSRPPFTLARLNAHCDEQADPGSAGPPELSGRSRVRVNIDQAAAPGPAEPGAGLAVTRLVRTSAPPGSVERATARRNGGLWIWAHLGPEIVLRAEFDARAFAPARVHELLAAIRGGADGLTH